VLAFPHTTSEADPAFVEIRERVRARLGEHGWTEPENLRIDLRYGDGDAARIPSIAAELMALDPDVVLVPSTPQALAFRKLTATTPIIFAGLSDPVGTGLVESLPHPGGNVTGMQSFEFPMVGKWMELLRDVSPGTRQLGILYNPVTAPFILAYRDQAASVAASLGLGALDLPVRSPEDIDRVYARAGDGDTGMIVIPDAYTYVQPQRSQIIDLAARYRLPAIYAFSVHAHDGGLMSFGPNQVNQFERAVDYVDRVFRGANPGDLPVQGPTVFDLVLNLPAARAIGLSFPPALLATATEVIE
jgi:putative ABC transport system substrate-binding protein